MPTYEYRCPQGHQFDHFFRKISDAEASMACPVCGEMATRLVSGGAGLLFKGSGFYITDYGKDGKKDQKAAAPKSETSSGSGSSDTSTKSAPSTGSSPSSSSSSNKPKE